MVLALQATTAPTEPHQTLPTHVLLVRTSLCHLAHLSALASCATQECIAPEVARSQSLESALLVFTAHEDAATRIAPTKLAPRASLPTRKAYRVDLAQQVTTARKLLHEVQCFLHLALLELSKIKLLKTSARGAQQAGFALQVHQIHSAVGSVGTVLLTRVRNQSLAAHQVRSTTTSMLKILASAHCAQPAVTALTTA